MQIRAANLNDWDWSRVKLVINPSGFLTEKGFIHTAGTIPSATAYTIGVMQFATSGGERFNPFTHVVQEVQITAYDPEGRVHVKSTAFR